MDGLTYRPLGQGEIRFLRLKSRNELAFEFVYGNLDSSQSYSALSYTWGAPVFPCHITIGGHRVSITENLYDALKVLVNILIDNKEHFLQKNLLWVDAVCVNQRDLDERSIHVRMMKNLYENAEKIFVWLGKLEDGDASILAAGKMRDFDDRMTITMKRNRPYRPWWWPNENRPPDDLASLLLNSATDKAVFDDPGSPTYRSWLAICAIWQRQWWNRTWVYQEATVPESDKAIFFRGVSVIRAQSRVVFLCGSSMFTWSQLRTTAHFANHLLSSKRQNTLLLKGATIPFENIWNLRIRRAQERPLSLLELLQIFRRTECKDPRDKVYAPLGLAAESATSFIIPDYRKRIQEVYGDVVRYQLTQKGSEFDFFAYATKLSQPARPPPADMAWSDWPSWVPNWYQPVAIAPLSKVLHVQKSLDGRSVRFYDKQGTRDHTKYQTKVYNASGDLESVVSIDGRTLHVKGIVCDTVAGLVDYNGPAETVREVNKRWAAESGGRYCTGESWVEALRRTNAVDVKYNSRGQAYDRNGSVDFDLLRRPREQLTVNELEIQLNANRALDRALHLRKLCRTENGFLGMVPTSTLLGDKICVLCGSQVLHVLRQMDPSFTSSGYAYIGECYVHGLMDGEVVSRVSDGHATIEHLVII